MNYYDSYKGPWFVLYSEQNYDPGEVYDGPVPESIAKKITGDTVLKLGYGLAPEYKGKVFSVTESGNYIESVIISIYGEDYAIGPFPSTLELCRWVAQNHGKCVKVDRFIDEGSVKYIHHSIGLPPQ